MCGAFIVAPCRCCATLPPFRTASIILGERSGPDVQAFCRDAVTGLTAMPLAHADTMCLKQRSSSGLHGGHTLNSSTIAGSRVGYLGAPQGRKPPFAQRSSMRPSSSCPVAIYPSFVSNFGCVLQCKYHALAEICMTGGA